MSIGAQLRASREARGLSLDALSRATRVQPRFLAAIERDDVAAVPPRPFGRGFVKAYAAEMGLDPEQVTHDYFARFAPQPVPPELGAKTATVRVGGGSRAWIYAVGVVGLSLGVAIAFLARTPERAAEVTPPPTAPTADTSDPAPAARTVPPTVTTTAAEAPLTVVFTAQRPAWVSATADGRREIYRTLTPGEPTRITAARLVEIRVGDAGALSWRVNGRDAGVMGRAGQVRDVRLTAENAATVQ